MLRLNECKENKFSFAERKQHRMFTMQRYTLISMPPSKIRPQGLWKCKISKEINSIICEFGFFDLSLHTETARNKLPTI